MSKLLSLFIICWLTSGCSTLIDEFLMPNDGVRPREYNVKTERDVGMKARDGITLVADVYHPIGLAQAPTILVRIPFTNTFSNRLRADAVARFWASRGYHVVIQGTRGRYKSAGTHYPLLGERDDGIDTLRWLNTQPWFDGRLGMWGGSAFGYTQWVLADQTNPGPHALAIQIASTDFYQMFYPGGAFSLESALFWAVRSRGSVDEDPKPKDLEKGYDGFPLIEADNRAIADIPFFNDWVTHRERDSYWRSIDGLDRARKAQAPVLLMAGWYDPFLPTQIRDFIDIRSAANRHVATETRLVIGPWSHADAVVPPNGKAAGDYRESVLVPSIDWFDRHLFGKKGARPSSPVLIYVMGDNTWREEQEWPLKRAQATAFYLHSQCNAAGNTDCGKLLPSKPEGSRRSDTYLYDPMKPVPSRGGAMLGPRAGIAKQNEIEARNDVLVYTSDVLVQDTEITGPIRAVLYVATSAKNTDFIVRLSDVHPNGDSYNVCDGILRTSSNSVADATRIEVDLWPTSMLFKEGHRIRVHVTSSSYPRFDRNPNTGREIPTETRTTAARQEIFHDDARPSHIVLPVIPR